MVTSSLVKAIAQSREVAAWAVRAVNKLSFERERRKILAATSLTLALDHHHAMPVLAQAGIPASVLALLRPAFEAYTRGVWLAYIASDQQIDDFAAGQHAPAFAVLCRRAAAYKRGGPSVGDVQEMAESLNHLTHGDIGHLCQRLGPGTVGPRYAEDDLIATLGLADWIAINAVLDAVGGVVGDIDRATNLMYEGQALLGA